jgi:hypothetical protein
MVATAQTLLRLRWRNDGQRLYDTIHGLPDSSLEAMHKQMTEIKKKMVNK